MNMTKAILAGLVAVGSVFAAPVLQLDISGGTYDSRTETIINQSNQFDLIALLNSDTYAGNYYISMALTPNTGVTAASDLGSVVFNGQTIDVTGDMVYGIPPVEKNLTKDNGDLAKHSIYPTFFTEFAFTFNPQSKAVEYNTENTPGGLNVNSAGSLYYRSFNVDVTNLAQNYSVHFDLYNEQYKSGGDIDVGINAPFSHDAEAKNVPEPATLSLFGMGLLALSGMGLIRRRK